VISRPGNTVQMRMGPNGRPSLTHGHMHHRVFVVYSISLDPGSYISLLLILADRQTALFMVNNIQQPRNISVPPSIRTLVQIVVVVVLFSVFKQPKAT
jgi:hypothetical protein